MGSTKYIGYSQNQITLAHAMKALAHPARVAILDLLLNEDALNCKQIAAELPLCESTISHHLKVMTEYNIVGFRVCINETFYTVNSITIDFTLSYLSGVKQLVKDLSIDYSDVYFNLSQVSPQAPFSQMI